MAEDESSRCWPGYEPVPGKAEHEQGSCRKKPESKSTPSDKKAQATRKSELDQWQKTHPGKKRSAAQHLESKIDPAPKKRATPKKKAAAKKASAKKAPAKKTTAATKKRAVKKAA